MCRCFIGMFSSYLQELLFLREKPIKVQYLQTACLRIKRNNNVIKTVLFRVTTALFGRTQTAHCFKWNTLSNCISAVHLINLTNGNTSCKGTIFLEGVLHFMCPRRICSFLGALSQTVEKKKNTSMKCFESESWTRHERMPALDGLCAQGKKIHS